MQPITYLNIFINHFFILDQRIAIKTISWSLCLYARKKMSKFKVKQNECAQKELKYSNNCSIKIVWSGTMFIFFWYEHTALYVLQTRTATNTWSIKESAKQIAKICSDKLFRMPPENMKIMRNNYFINKTEEKTYEQNNCKFV